MSRKTYMSNNDFILARNPGISPVRLLFDKSLKFVRKKKSLTFMNFLSSRR